MLTGTYGSVMDRALGFSQVQLQAQKDRQVLMASKAFKGHRANRDLKAKKAKKANKVSLVRRDRRDRKGQVVVVDLNGI